MESIRVALVGAGPGDPGLLTVRGAELLAACDCVVYDYLVNPEILERVPAGAARHFVGKKGRASSTPQAEIERLLIDCARHHKLVVRLKGGDPFVFGRGGEEAAALAAAGIAFAIVPGVTSGIAAPAYAGIPVTHRATSSAVAFVTGHQQDGADAFDWAAVAQIETLVLYMGMHRLAENCAALVAAGRAATTPAAAIQWGSWAKQRVVIGTLADLADRTAAAGLGAPAITVVGEVVRFRERIRWFDNRPLSGRRILVTRPQGRVGPLTAALHDTGAEIVQVAASELVAGDPADLDAALELLRPGDWIAFASARAVEAVAERLVAHGRDARALAGVRLAAVGPGTAERLRDHRLMADLVPTSADGSALAAAIAAAAPAPARVLLPRADNARAELESSLHAAGFVVDPVIAYLSRPLPLAPTVLDRLDAVVLTSSATAERLAAALGADAVAALGRSACKVVAIGPRTAATARDVGFIVAATAASPTPAALVETLLRELAPA